MELALFSEDLFDVFEEKPDPVSQSAKKKRGRDGESLKDVGEKKAKLDTPGITKLQSSALVGNASSSSPSSKTPLDLQKLDEGEPM